MVSCAAETTIEASAQSGPTSADDSVDNTNENEPTAVPSTTVAEPTAVPPTAVPDTTDDSIDDPATGDTITSRDEAVAYIIGEGFDPSDAECLVDGAYQVFGTWDFAELDPEADQEEELDLLLDSCITVVPGPAAGSPPPGADAELDALWVSCDGGSAQACDDLYWQSPGGSDYESFGFSCGGRTIDVCSTVLGDDSGGVDVLEDGEVPGPAAGSPPPGTDAELDALWISCDGGSAEACDDLYFESPLGSDYEAFGFSCGGRSVDVCSFVLDE